MPKVQFDIASTLPPEKIMGAMLDFSDRRPDLWPGLARKYYEVYEIGETEADIREGSGAPFNVWAREHYDWATPWRVSWTVQESNFCAPGNGVVMTVEPRPNGSNVHIDWERTPTTLKGKFIIGMIGSNGGKRLQGFINKGYAALAKQSDLPSYTPSGG
jgi:hypothetical protein